MSTYKYCIVPMCDSTTAKYPQKMFISAPRDEVRRKQWCRLMKRVTLSPKSTSYVCEDHFDMPNDTENYMRVKLTGGKIICKKTAFPHLFKCQKKHSLPGRPLSEQRKRKSMVNELIKNYSSTNSPVSSTIDSNQTLASAPVIIDSNQTLASAPVILEESVVDTDEKKVSFKDKGVQARCHFRSKATQVGATHRCIAHLCRCKGPTVQSSGTVKKKAKNHRPVKPTVRVAKEPTDDYPNPSSSKDTANGEFILPHVDTSRSSKLKEEQQITLSVASLRYISEPETVKIKEEPTDNYPTSSTFTSNGTASEEFILPHDSSWMTPSPVVEPQYTLLVTSLRSPSELETSNGEQLKKILRTNLFEQTNYVLASKHTAVISQSPEQNCEKILNLNSSKGQFHSFGNFVATKLESLDPVSSACAQKAIQNIILEAEMGKYLSQTQDIKPQIVPVSI